MSGPIIVAGAVAAGSPALAVLLTALITVAGTAWFATASPPGKPRGTPGVTRTARAIGKSGLRVVLGATALMGFGVGAVEVALTALAVHHGSRSIAGILLGLCSVGSMIGGVAYGARVWRSPLTARFPTLLMAVTITTAPLIFAGSLAVAIPLSLLSGVGFAPTLGCEYTLVGALSPRETAAEAFGWISTALVAGIAAGNAVTGPLVQAGRVNDAFGLACLATGLAAATALIWRRLIEVAVAHSQHVARPLGA